MNVTKAEQTMEPDFKSQFYNLQGTHIDERKKNFYKLLKSTSPDLPKDQFDIQPRSYQENIFYVDILIHFKQEEKLMEILKEGNAVLISKILKHKWFFQNTFKNIKDEDIVNHLLPTLSYSVRMKVLKKLSLVLSEERMDNIFDLILERYGLFIAKQFLFSCSSQKIINVLQNNEITLLSEQLKRLLQKDIKLLKVYFEEHKKNTRHNFDDHHFLNYLIRKHPNMYLELGFHENNFIKLGYYTTKTVIKTNRKEVLQDIQNERFNKNALVREIKTFDKDYLHLYFPENMQNINRFSTAGLALLVTKYPIKKRWNVLEQAFKQAYKKEILDHLGCFDIGLAVFFPKEIKQKWAEIKYSAADKFNNIEYIKYFDPQKAFKLLKDKINVTSGINQRGVLLNEMITVCHENEDYFTLEAVLKYICIRHRNEDNHVRANMIRHLERHVNYSLLTETHWQYINEIIQIQRARDETLPFTIMTEYLLFEYLRKYPLVDELVSQYIQDCIKISRSFRLLPKCMPAEGNILKHIVRLLPTLKLENEKQLTLLTYDLLFNIVDFNKDVINNKEKSWFLIDFNDHIPMMKLIKEVCAKKGSCSYNYNDYDYEVVAKLVLYNCLYSENPIRPIKPVIDEDDLLALIKEMSIGDYKDKFNSCILEVIQKKQRTKFENDLLDYYFSTNKDYLQPCAIQYFFANEPEVISKYFGVILSADTKMQGNLFNNYNAIKTYSHLELDKQLILHFKGLVSKNSKYDKKSKILNALSAVMDTKSFLELVKDYTPDTMKLDLNSKEQNEIYKLQCDIVKFFKKLDDPVILAPAVIHFSQGDYLQSSLPTLYKVLYLISEEKVIPYLNVLADRAVSPRKHSAFLSFKLLSVKDAVTIYSELSKKETNISARKYLFDVVLKYFLKTYLESLLHIVFVNMEFVDKNDTELIDTIINSVHKIPNKYKPVFIEKLWNFLDILERQDVKVKAYRNRIMYAINDYGVSFIYRLNKDFCDGLLDTYFLTNNHQLREADVFDQFAINYLLAYLDEQHFQFVFNKIKSYKTINQSNTDEMNYVFRFFTNAYGKFGEKDINFLRLFNSFWQSLFSQEECFSEYTLLGLMTLYKENTTIKEFSIKADKFFQELIVQYGPYISDFLITSIKVFFDKLQDPKMDFDIINFAWALLKSTSSDFNCFAAFYLANNTYIYKKDQKNIYIEIADMLKAVDNKAAKIYHNTLSKKSIILIG